MSDTQLPGTSLFALASLRTEYAARALTEDSAGDDPFQQFALWFQDALDARVAEPNAMTLATADLGGRPSGRVVLLKGFDSRGFVFFTNYQSQKGHDLTENPRAALVFYWHELERQIRVEGNVAVTSDEESDTYFDSRPIESRVGAWASEQSRVATNREEIDERQRLFARQFEGQDIPRPGHWGGYRLSPLRLEFWQGRPSRLHDRLVYRKLDESRWIRERLYP